MNPVVALAIPECIGATCFLLKFLEIDEAHLSGVWEGPHCLTFVSPTVRGPYCQLNVGLCDVDVFLHWNRAAEEGAGVGLNRTFKEAPDSTCWGSIFGPPCKGNVFKKGSESGPAWNQKWSPLEGPVLVPFWHLHCGKSVEAFISSRSWFNQHQLRLESWTGEAHFCAPAFS